MLHHRAGGVRRGARCGLPLVGCRRGQLVLGPEALLDRRLLLSEQPHLRRCLSGAGVLLPSVCCPLRAFGPGARGHS